MHSVEDMDADGVPVRIYRPTDSTEPQRALVYFHGGGFVIGSLDTHDGIARALAARADCIVVSVDYRLAPEHRYPAALDDCWTATRWVIANAERLGIDPDRIGVGGDSVGGNLATIVARKGRDAGTPFAVQLLIYPSRPAARTRRRTRCTRSATGSRGTRWPGTGGSTSATTTAAPIPTSHRRRFRTSAGCRARS